MKKALLLAFVAALLLSPVVAFADNLDTVTGTPITAEGQNNFMRYTDAGGAPKDIVSTESITTVVMPMYGFGGLFDPDPSHQQVTTPGVPKTYTYVISNEGNDSDTYTLSTHVTQMAGATGWTIAILNSDGITPMSSIGLSEDGSDNILVKVTPGSLPSQAPNGSYVVVTLEASTAKTPVGVYLGANGISYGGTSDAINATVTTIETSVMTLSRTATVDAPTTYISNGGGAHDAVPGAVITYTIMVSNEGSSYANNVIIVDKVPTSTEAAHMGATAAGQDGLTHVTITVPQVNPAAGWSAYFSTLDSPDTTYGAPSGWTSITAVPTSFATGSGITYVKYEKQTVEAVTEMAKTLTWGVMIR